MNFISSEKVRGTYSLYFRFLKVLHLYVSNQNNDHCDIQGSRNVLLIGPSWTTNKVILKKWNTWSKPYSHRPCMHLHAYLLFLKTSDVCIATWYSHTGVNWHLVDTWLLRIFLKGWTVELPLLKASTFFTLKITCSFILRPGYAVYQVSCWCRLHICNGLGFT